MKLNPAYIAGVTDSDGSLCCGKVKSKRHTNGYYFNPMFSLHWKRLPQTLYVIKSLKKIYGGYYCIIRGDNKWQKNDMYLYSLSCRGLDKFLLDITPFLQIKQKQARLIAKLRTLKRKNQGIKTTKQSLSIQETFYNKIKILNHKVVNS